MGPTGIEIKKIKADGGMNDNLSVTVFSTQVVISYEHLA